MDPELYRSAQKCHVSVLRQYENQLHEQLDQNMNNLLHVCAQFHAYAEFVKEILDNTQSSKEVKRFMLTGKNSEGETALHIASRNGQSNTVRVLIERAKALDHEYQYEELESGGVKIAEEMMRATDKNGNTALHLAVRNNHAYVAELLLTHDPHFKHPANTIKETPLYLALERDYHVVVDLIITKCMSQNYEGPGGKTALHAAVLSHCEECVTRIVKENPALTRQADELGWIPLHYAAYYPYGYVVLPLIIADRSTAYTRTSKHDNRTALHIAACRGNFDAMEQLLSHCPDCWNMVTSKGQNLLHLVAESKEEIFSSIDRSELLKTILRHKWATNLINDKDVEGNTPLHLYAKRASDDPVLDLDVSYLVEHPLLDRNAVNNENFTPLDVMLKSGNFAQGLSTEMQHKALEKLHKAGVKRGDREGMSVDKYFRTYNNRNAAEKRQRMLEELRKRAETHLLVATLIATVTFAAGFTLPGGYDGNAGNNQGMAVLTRKAAFTTFVVTDAIALISSMTAVFLDFSATLLHDNDDDAKKFYRRQMCALVLIVIAVMTVVIAFITGLYTVLQHGSPALAITICVMGCFVVLLFCIMIRREVIIANKLIITCLVYIFYDVLGRFYPRHAFAFLEYCRRKNIVET